MCAKHYPLVSYLQELYNFIYPGFAGFPVEKILGEKALAKWATISVELSKQRAECGHNTEKHDHLGSALFQVSIVSNICP